MRKLLWILLLGLLWPIQARGAPAFFLNTKLDSVTQGVSNTDSFYFWVNGVKIDSILIADEGAGTDTHLDSVIQGISNTDSFYFWIGSNKIDSLLVSDDTGHFNIDDTGHFAPNTHLDSVVQGITNTDSFYFWIGNSKIDSILIADASGGGGGVGLADSLKLHPDSTTGKQGAYFLDFANFTGTASKSQIPWDTLTAYWDSTKLKDTLGAYADTTQLMPKDTLGYYSLGTDTQMYADTAFYAVNAAGSIDSFYVKWGITWSPEGWKQTGDTLFWDTTSLGGGSIDSFYYAMGIAWNTGSGWLYGGDTVYVDTTSGGGTDTWVNSLYTAEDTLGNDSLWLVKDGVRIAFVVIHDDTASAAGASKWTDMGSYLKPAEGESVLIVTGTDSLWLTGTGLGGNGIGIIVADSANFNKLVVDSSLNLPANSLNDSMIPNNITIVFAESTTAMDTTYFGFQAYVTHWAGGTDTHLDSVTQSIINPDSIFYWVNGVKIDSILFVDDTGHFNIDDTGHFVPDTHLDSIIQGITNTDSFYLWIGSNKIDSILIADDTGHFVVDDTGHFAIDTHLDSIAQGIINTDSFYFWIGSNKIDSLLVSDDTGHFNIDDTGHFAPNTHLDSVVQGITNTDSFYFWVSGDKIDSLLFADDTGHFYPFGYGLTLVGDSAEADTNQLKIWGDKWWSGIGGDASKADIHDSLVAAETLRWKIHIHDSLVAAQSLWQRDAHDTLLSWESIWQGQINDSLIAIQGIWQDDINDSLIAAQSLWQGDVNDSLVAAQTLWQADISDTLDVRQIYLDSTGSYASPFLKGYFDAIVGTTSHSVVEAGTLKATEGVILPDSSLDTSMVKDAEFQTYIQNWDDTIGWDIATVVNTRIGDSLYTAYTAAKQDWRIPLFVEYAGCVLDSNTNTGGVKVESDKYVSSNTNYQYFHISTDSSSAQRYDISIMWAVPYYATSIDSFSLLYRTGDASMDSNKLKVHWFANGSAGNVDSVTSVTWATVVETTGLGAMAANDVLILELQCTVANPNDWVESADIWFYGKR